MRRKLWLTLVVCALALGMACARESTGPASPTSTDAADAEAAADGSTLKTTAPIPQSPVNGQRLTQGVPVTLVITNSTMTYASGVALTYRFEVYNAAGAVVYAADNVAAGSGTTTSNVVTVELVGDQTYTWQARAEYQGTVGPFSSRVSFVAAPTEGYIRGSELYDPLINGKTVGRAHGPVTFIPGVGLRLDSQTSWVEYQLPVPLHGGELSALITNIGMATSGLKTKVFSMSQGSDDITVDRRRFTVEKRGATEPGSIAWRVIASEGPIETIGNERMFVTFSPANTYFWRATWDVNFRLVITQGGVGGQNIYDFSRKLDGVYDPSPHFVYLGSPPPRGGPDSQSAPGIVIRQLWVSRNPRPDYANR